ncbi:hypothetical protein BDR06DRAFT_431884 [Suillus hirtellus]|nr:hypothetical protein BDR06DRAFT_431884 [Suillus hirtellus]
MAHTFGLQKIKLSVRLLLFPQVIRPISRIIIVCFVLALAFADSTFACDTDLGISSLVHCGRLFPVRRTCLVVLVNFILVNRCLSMSLSLHDCPPHDVEHETPTYPLYYADEVFMLSDVACDLPWLSASLMCFKSNLNCLTAPIPCDAAPNALDVSVLRHD